MTLMYDSTSAKDIPPNAQVVAGYVNGKDSQWSESDWLLFPKALKVRIAVYIPGLMIPMDGNVFDAEEKYLAGGQRTDCLHQLDIWTSNRLNSGVQPVCYTSASTWEYVKNRPLKYWIADYTGMPHLLPGTVATQFVSEPGGAHYDVSMTNGVWPGFTPPTQEVNMLMSDVVDIIEVIQGSGKYYELTRDGGVRATNNLGVAIDNVPLVNYAVLASDGGVYYFGPSRNGGVWSYPGLPDNVKNNPNRYFTKIWLG